MKLSIEEIVNAVSGEWMGNLPLETIITNVEFDTRKVVEGTLFVPLKGARDGHDFIENAFENGAAITFSNRELEKEVPYIKVADPLKAFQELAIYYLNKVKPKVVGITGSNGKTTTKDMTAAVLSTTYKTYKTQGNYNNEIGLPYTIMNMSDDTEVIVLEMGMDRKGDIELLSTIGEPDVAAITLIGESHIEHLGSRKGIAEAKMEIVSGLKATGTLIVPSDEPLIDSLLKPVTQKTIRFGLNDKADMTADILEELKNQTTFKTNLDSETIFSIPVLGKYNVSNALIAILVGKELGVSIEKIQEGLADFDLTKNRTEWLETPQGMAILSDVYNANPTAMNLVLDSFSKIVTPGKKVVVLGDMLELGEGSKAMHESVAAHLDPEAIAEVYLYGEEMAALLEKIKAHFSQEQLHYFKKDEKDQLIQELKQNLHTSDTVFLKASNGMGLKEVVDELLKNH